MPNALPLAGLRVHLSASEPDESTAEQKVALARFIRDFVAGVLREGGSIIHGSSPTVIDSILKAAKTFVDAGDRRDRVTLVRAWHYAQAQHKTEIESHEKLATVEIIPPAPGNPAESLISMREWMAERCDVIVAAGGRWSKIDKSRAGVPAELDEALRRGKPGFIVTAFGGAAEDELKDNTSLLERLKNGLSPQQNRDLAAKADVESILAQLKLLPLVRPNVTSGRLFRILALDGGGLRGAFTAAVLAQWADQMGPNGGVDLVKHFDIVAGTSTGAILAIGLGLGLPPLEILNFYRTQGPIIFPPRGFFRGWFRSKYQADILEKTLTGVFKDKKLASSHPRLVIPTIRADHGEAEILVTPHTPDRMAFKDMSAVQAARASSAAPTYFDDAKVGDKIATESYLDGGMWSNNPSIPAIAEAVGQLGIPINRIDLLSVGTTGAEADFNSALDGGKANYVTVLTDLFFAAQESGTVRLVDDLLTRARHLRINQQTSKPISLDDAKAIEELATRGKNAGIDSFPLVRSRFLDGFFAPPWKRPA